MTDYGLTDHESTDLRTDNGDPDPLPEKGTPPNYAAGENANRPATEE